MPIQNQPELRKSTSKVTPIEPRELTPALEVALPDTDYKKSIRTYSLGLGVPSQYRQEMLSHLECYTRAVKAGQDAFLKVFGSLDASLIDKTFSVIRDGKVIDSPPTEDQKIQRKILLTRLWLFPVSSEGAPKEYVVDNGNQKKGRGGVSITDAQIDARTSALRGILSEQGLNGDQIEEWISQTKLELHAPVVANSCLINTRKMFLDDKENFGSKYNSDTAFELLNQAFLSPGDLFSIVEGQENQSEKEVEDLAALDGDFQDQEIEAEEEDYEEQDEEESFGKNIKGAKNLDRNMMGYYGRVMPSAKGDKTAINFAAYLPKYEIVVEASRDIKDGTPVREVLVQIARNINTLCRNKNYQNTSLPIEESLDGIKNFLDDKRKQKRKRKTELSKLFEKFEKQLANDELNSEAVDKKKRKPEDFNSKFYNAAKIDLRTYQVGLSRGRRQYSDHLISTIENAFGYKLSGDAASKIKSERNIIRAILGEAARDISKTVTNLKKVTAGRIISQRQIDQIRSKIPTDKFETLERFCSECNPSNGSRYHLRRGTEVLPKVVNAWNDPQLDTPEKRIEKAKSIIFSEAHNTGRKHGWRTIFVQLASKEGIELFRTESGALKADIVLDFFKARELEVQASGKFAPSMRLADPDFSLRTTPFSSSSGFDISIGGLELAQKIALRDKVAPTTLEWFDHFCASNTSTDNSLKLPDAVKFKEIAQNVTEKWQEIDQKSRAYKNWQRATGGTIEDYRRKIVGDIVESGSITEKLLVSLAAESAWHVWHVDEGGKAGQRSLDKLVDCIVSYNSTLQLENELQQLNEELNSQEINRPRGDKRETPCIASASLRYFNGYEFVERRFPLGSDRFYREIITQMYEGSIDREPNLPPLPRNTTFARIAAGLAEDDKAFVGNLATLENWACNVKLHRNTKQQLLELNRRQDLDPDQKARERAMIIKHAQFEILPALKLDRKPKGFAKYLAVNGMEVIDTRRVFEFIKAQNKDEKRSSPLAQRRFAEWPAGLRVIDVRLLKGGGAAKIAVIETASAEQVRELCNSAGVVYPDNSQSILVLRDPITGKNIKFRRNGHDQKIDPQSGETKTNPSPWSRIERVNTLRFNGEYHNQRIRRSYPEELLFAKNIARDLGRSDMPGNQCKRLSGLQDYVNSTLRIAVDRQNSRARISFLLNPATENPHKKAKNSDSSIGRVSSALIEWRRLAYDNPTEGDWGDQTARESFDSEVFALLNDEQKSKFQEGTSINGVLKELAKEIVKDEALLKRIADIWAKEWSRHEHPLAVAIQQSREWYGGGLRTNEGNRTSALRFKRVKPEELQQQGIDDKIAYYKIPSEGGLTLERDARGQNFRRVDQAYSTRQTPLNWSGDRSARLTQHKYMESAENRRIARRHQIVAMITREVLGLVETEQSRYVKKPVKLDKPYRNEHGRMVKFSYETHQPRGRYVQKYPTCHVCILELEDSNDRGSSRRAKENALHANLGQDFIKEKLSQTLDLLDIVTTYSKRSFIPRDYHTGAPGIAVREVRISDFLKVNGPWWSKIKEAEKRVRETEAAELAGRKIEKNKEATSVDHYIYDLFTRFNRATNEWTDLNNRVWVKNDDRSWSLADEISPDNTVKTPNEPPPVILPDPTGPLFISAGDQHGAIVRNLDGNGVVDNALKLVEDPDWGPHLSRLRINARTLKPDAEFVRGSRIVSSKDEIPVMNHKPQPRKADASGVYQSDKMIDVYRDPSDTPVTEGIWMTWEDYRQDVTDRAIANLRESFENSTYLH